ncbi:zinc ABC transporter substrate-binding protein [Collinsella sp. zg1085]|uniref:metal ABC transporter solute-binding protein, Zn/Mn family n=1 Tax=Collinsella sp. zg1085 TaxID=2844380 RepID=UPI001C0ABE90|nr:zinc ABC transporter substrate-binding protein [Collinsella sp. zg1085]QWT17457.1 zinc ABC transporter substrate-binding protein [Collinsella sp. zg1085]
MYDYAYTRRAALKLGFAASTLGLGALLAGCTTPRNTDGRPLIFASFYPVVNLVQAIVGETADVRAFMPTNKDPHAWEPTPRRMAELAESDALILNGANMERWAPQVRNALPQLPILTLSDSIDLITYKGAAAMGEFQYMARLELESGTYGFEFGHTHEDIMRVAFFKPSRTSSLEELVAAGREIMREQGQVVAQHKTFTVKEKQVYALEMGHESGYIGFTLPSKGPWVLIADRASESLLSYRLVNNETDAVDIPAKSLLEGSSSGHDTITFDPHSWLSLLNAKRACNALYDYLVERYPQHADIYRKNKRKIVSRLTELSAEYDQKFAELERREFVVTHNAYAYLCRDFNIKQYPLQGLTSTEAPALKTMRKAISFCKERHIRTIFYEQGQSSKGADTLAAEIGGATCPLCSMEYVADHDGADAGGYVEIMRSNIEAIYQSLYEEGTHAHS